MIWLTLLTLVSALHPTTYCCDGHCAMPTVTIHVTPFSWTTEQRLTKPYAWGGPYLSYMPLRIDPEFSAYASLSTCPDGAHDQHITLTWHPPYVSYFRSRSL
jgi:hypothetical protein